MTGLHQQHAMKFTDDQVIQLEHVVQGWAMDAQHLIKDSAVQIRVV